MNASINGIDIYSEKIFFEGEEYKVRIIRRELIVVVAELRLYEPITTAIENGSVEALSLDEQIVYYANDDEFKLSDEELLNVIY